MKTFRGWWAVVGAAALSAVLAGCGGSSDDSGTVSLRIANATLTHASLDLLVNASTTVAATASDTVSGYITPASGSTTLQISDTGSSTALATTVPTLTASDHYTLLAYESGGAVKTLLLSEDYSTPSSGTAQLRVINAAPDSGKLDVYITDTTTALSSSISPTTTLAAGTSYSSTLTYSPGTYRVRITGHGSQSDLRLDIPSVTLTNEQFGIVTLTPASGGLLLNGSTVIQQSTYAATRNTNVRVRLAAAVSDSATVAASATSGTTTTTIDSGSVAPAFGYYVLVPASSALNISVDGNSVSAPATTLASLVGSDATLLVYRGTSSATATATLITDDNRPPSDTTTVKLRLLNGITGTGSTGTLTFTANSTLIGGGIAAGAASSYVSVLGSTTAMNLSLTSSLASGTYFSDTGEILSVGGVYTVMAAGDFASPQLLIR